MGGTPINWTLGGSFFVRGQLTGFEYETLPGETVKVTNNRTGQSKVTTAEASGEYRVDLSDVASFPSGYAIGDEIQIDASHFGSSRQWKRRIGQAVDIEQDAYFTHGTWQGAARRSKMLLTTDAYTQPAGPVIQFRDALTRDVVEVRVNNAKISEDEWAFARPNFLTITKGLSSSDVVDVDRLQYLGIQQVRDIVVLEGDAQVRDAAARYYPSPFPNRSPQLQEISETIAAARIRDQYWSGGDKTDSEGKSLREFARDRLAELHNGTANLTDYNGSYIKPVAKPTTTPQSTPNPARAYTRFSDVQGPRVDQ